MSPYIEQHARQPLEACLAHLVQTISTKGELTYALTVLGLGYVDKRGRSYDSYSDVLGCLTATTHELYRTEVGKYEDAKRISNGPVRVVPDPEPCGAGDCEGECISPRRCPCGSGGTGCEHPCCGSDADTYSPGA